MKHVGIILEFIIFLMFFIAKGLFILRLFASFIKEVIFLPYIKYKMPIIR